MLPLVLGLSDGILNALVLAAGSIVGATGHLAIGLALRVGTAALVTAVLTVYVATYAEQRAHLVHASRELNLSSRGHLATTKLGRAAIRDAPAGTATAAASSFLGAVFPLLIGSALRKPTWLPLVVSIAALAALGVGVGHVVAGSRLRWCIVLAISGAVVAYIGLQLRIT